MKKAITLSSLLALSIAMTPSSFAGNDISKQTIDRATYVRLMKAVLAFEITLTDASSLDVSGGLAIPAGVYGAVGIQYLDLHDFAEYAPFDGRTGASSSTSSASSAPEFQTIPWSARARQAVAGMKEGAERGKTYWRIALVGQSDLEKLVASHPGLDELFSEEYSANPSDATMRVGIMVLDLLNCFKDGYNQSPCGPIVRTAVPEAQLYFLMSMDNLVALSGWYDQQEIVTKAQRLVESAGYCKLRKQVGPNGVLMDKIFVKGKRNFDFLCQHAMNQYPSLSILFPDVIVQLVAGYLVPSDHVVTNDPSEIIVEPTPKPFLTRVSAKLRRARNYVCTRDEVMNPYTRVAMASLTLYLLVTKSSLYWK